MCTPVQLAAFFPRARGFIPGSAVLLIRRAAAILTSHCFNLCAGSVIIERSNCAGSFFVPNCDNDLFIWDLWRAVVIFVAPMHE